ncbi:hypothetical protein ACWD7M_26170 [Streptomyces griseus]
MSEDDDTTAAEASLRKAVEQLCGGTGRADGSKAAQEAVQALADGSGKAWTP